MPRPTRQTPAESISGPWPETRSDDPIAEVARLLVVNLATAMEGRGHREVGRAAGIHHTTLGKILAGGAWPDAETIAKLERTLDCDLWPGRVTAGDS